MLRQVVLARKIATKRAELAKLQEARSTLTEQREALKVKEAELEAAVREMTDETPEEDRAAIDAEVQEFEARSAEADAAEAENDQAQVDLQGEIDQLQGELDELNDKVKGNAPAAEPVPASEGTTEGATEDRAERTGYTMRNSVFGTAQQRAALFAREDVREFAQRVRQVGKEKRAISGGELLIPEIMLPMIREQVERDSKLIKYVNLQHVGGTARETIMGTIPEAVWTEMCANLNELALSFADVEVDGYKVGGYIPVCNALLEDNDVNLVSQIIFALARAIAIALDKAILYGTGTKMPMGIVTRLAQTAKPAGYPTTARAWEDLHSSNIKSITAANSTGIKLFQGLMDLFGGAKKKYSAGGKFWAMNEKTHAKLMAEALSFNAAGAIVTGIGDTMPVIGGDIVELDFIPDNVIIAGYGELYLLAERSGVQLASSEHFLFTADKTVYKGTARYDGTPVIPEGFVAIGIAGATVKANEVTFTADTANE